VVVTGPDPRDLIDPITPADLRAAVVAALLGDWANQLAEGADDRHLPETLRFIAHAVEVARAAG